MHPHYTSDRKLMRQLMSRYKCLPSHNNENQLPQIDLYYLPEGWQDRRKQFQLFWRNWKIRILHTGDTEYLDVCRQKQQDKKSQKIKSSFFQVSGVMWQVSGVTWHVSGIWCLVSRVTCCMLLTSTATATDLSPANSSSMHKRMLLLIWTQTLQ